MQDMRARLREQYGNTRPKRTSTGPTDFSSFVGQRRAVDQLTVAIASAKARGKRLDHTLLASGHSGIGKTTLAEIIAALMDVDMVKVTGQVGVVEAQAILSKMRDGDILFWDEMHQAMAGSKTKVEWLLTYLEKGELITSTGAVSVPDVTVIGATTDAGVLPQTVIKRFMIQPRLEPYTPAEGARIAESLAVRMEAGIVPAHDTWDRIATAANNSTRDMEKIIVAARDLTASRGALDLTVAFDWAGVTYDGLSAVSQDMLIALLGAPEHTLSIDTIKATLGEPGPLRHAEQTLLQKGLTTITGRGRRLTEDGKARAIQLVLADEDETEIDIDAALRAVFATEGSAS